MTNEIIAGVSRKLYQAFGNGYRIYKNDVKQGLTEPCFFIAILAPSHNPYLGRRRRIAVPLDVHYIPEDGGDNGTMADVGDRLFSELEYITDADGNMHRGRDMSYEIQDGVLHFFVTYAVILNEYDKGETMEILNLSESIKEE